MVDFVLKVAGYPILVHANFESTKEYCRKYLVDEEPVFTVSVGPEDFAYEKRRYHRDRIIAGQEAPDTEDALFEQTAVQRKLAEQLFDYDVIVFHGSVVAVDGQAFLFTAKSGTGKSTHTRFWRETFGDRAVMVNDDKPFLRITEDGVIAYGAPWNGKHRIGKNVSMPLKAICILERGVENEICKITGNEAVTMLFQQSNWPVDPKKMSKHMDLIDRLSKKTEFYRMKCNLDPDAARVAYEAMSK